MRYEDASGAFQASGPVANDDSDTLPAGSKQPATGNLITGEGTQYASSGADSAAGAHITNIAGKGGEDSSFAGGKLSVAGEFGNLSVDAQGNYIYKANANAPENVRDRFTYTLADSSGNTDTAALVVELGKTPVVVKADAQQVIVGPDGVVTLPPGVELSDIMVVGRNLVVTLPDGSQMIIIDGAIFVPQLVLGGVEVPATNVAALLIGQEPQPAAGELPPSSGGNFALPPPPLDPGVPLGDLIPPMEDTYIPPEPQEVFDTFDDEPEVGPNPDVLLDDDALQAGNAGGVGDDPDSVNATGQLSGSGGDGDLTFAVQLTGAPDGFTYVSGGAGIVLIQQGGVTVLTVTVDADGSYSVVQNNPIDHPAGGDENNVSFTLNYTVTDEDGDSAAGTFTINVDDDTPLLTDVVSQGGVTLDESDYSIAGFPISGNSALPVIDFTALFGADGAAAVDSASIALVINGGGNSGLQTAVGNYAITLVQIDDNTIEGHYNGSNVAFVIELEADNSITLTQIVPLEHNVDGPPGPAHDDSLDLGGLIAVQVTITDGDGDTATEQVGIGDSLIFKDDGPTAQVDPEARPDTVVLDETRPEGTDTDDNSPDATLPNGLASDTLDFADNFGTPDFGADGAGTVTYQLVLSANGIGSGLYALEAGDTSAGDGDGYGQGAEITLSQSGNTITGSVGETEYFTITIDPETGEVTFTQLNPIWHDTPGDWDETATLNTESAADIQVQQTVTDSDGDFDTAQVDIGRGVFSIQDDGPDEFEECPEDVITINQPGSEFTGELNLPDVGEDEPGVVTFNVEDGDPVLDTGGQPVVSNGVALFYFINDDGVLEARAGDETGELIFTITLNPDGTTYTYEQFGTIGDSGEISFTDLTSSAAGNVDYRAVGEDDPATTVDLILSGSDSGGADQGVNTDSDSIGVDNQSMDVGETLRVDFVSNLETAPVAAGTPMGLTYDNHVDTNTYLQTIPQVQGTQTNEVAFQVWALDTSDTQADEPDRNPAGGFANSNIVTITSVTVVGFDVGESSPVTLDISAIAVGVWTDVAYGISVQKQADGSVIFTGVQEGDQYGIGTGANSFNSVAVQAEPEGTGPIGNESNEDSFDLGVFSIGTDADIEPVDLTIPISLTDADGDPVVCDIDIHLGPPVNVDDVTVTVNEAGLDLIGSDPGSDSEFFLNGDLTGQVTGGTPPYTFALAPGESATGTYGTLTLNPDGTFSYELTSPVDSQPDADDGTNPELAADSFQVVATDDDGNTQTLTINVNIIDDVPTAVDDTDEVVEGGSTSGNVLTGDGGDGDPAGEDTPGADGFATDAVVGVVTGDNDAVDTDNPATVGVVITGTYGELTLNADGSYTYEAFADIDPPPGAVDEFVYTVMDGDGDLHSAVLTINVIDDLTPTLDVPTTGEAGTFVDEAGLPPRTGEPAGTGENADSLPNNESDDSEITSGTINFTPGDEPATVTIDGLGAGGPVTITAAGQVIEGRYGTMVIDSYNAGTGTITYTYTLNDNVDHDSQPDTDPFTVRVEDVDGDFVEDTLTIDIIDDEPIAVDDTDSIPSGEYGPALGNVITDAEGDGGDDNVGADDAVVVGVAAGDTNSNLESAPTVGAVIQGTYGKLTLNSDGSYSYTRDPGTDGGVQDVFTYTIEDGDGDQTNATLTITIGDSTPDVPENTNVGLDDDALTGGNAAGTGDDPNAVNTSGSVASTVGDGPLTYALLGTGEPVGFDYVLQGNGDLWIMQGTTHVLTVTLDQSGNYTVSQVNPIVHPAGSDENNVSFTVTFSATDQDGDFDEGTLTIDVDDDSPVNFTPVPLTDTPPLVAPTQDDALVNDGSANVTRLLNDPNNDGVGSNFMGADGFGSLYFTGTPADDGQALTNGGGTPLTSGGDPIYLFGFGTDTLYASTDPAFDPESPTGLVFTVTLNEGTGFGSTSTYTIDFDQTIDNGSGVFFEDLSGGDAGNPAFKLIESSSADSLELLVTPIGNTTVNSDEDDIATGSQFIEYADGIRFDFGQFTFHPNGGGGNDDRFTIDAHEDNTNGFKFSIDQISNGTVVDIRVTAIDADEDGGAQQLNIDPDADDVIDDITSIKVYDDNGVLVDEFTGTDTTTYSFDVIFNGDGSVSFENLPSDYSIQTYTLNGYNRIEVFNEGTASPDGKFSLSNLSIETVQSGDPIDLSFDVTAEDADGDTSTGTIDVILVPDNGSSALTTLAATSESSDTSSFSLLASDSEEQLVQKTAANSNTLTLAAAIAGAGLTETIAAERPDRGSHRDQLDDDGHSVKNTKHAVADDGGDAAVSMLAPESSEEASASADTSNSSSSDNQSESNSLDDGASQASADGNDAPASDSGNAADGSADAASLVAPTVSMPAAEVLQAAANDDVGGNADGEAQQGGAVEQIVAEALGHGGAPLIDAILAGLPGGNGELATITNMASPQAGSVSGWDMGGHGAFGAGFDMMFKMDVATHHQDAVQPVANG